MTKDEALKMSLDAMEGADMIDCDMRDAITAIKEALAQPEQEPDWKGLVLSHNEDCESRCDMDRCGYKPYYEYNGRRCPDCPIHEKIWVEYTPPQRKPLTDEEIDEISKKHIAEGTRSFEVFARAIEAAHGIKGEA